MPERGEEHEKGARTTEESKQQPTKTKPRKGGGTDSPEPVYGQKSQVPTSHPVREKRAGAVGRERMIRPKEHPAHNSEAPPATD